MKRSLFLTLSLVFCLGRWTAAGEGLFESVTNLAAWTAPDPADITADQGYATFAAIDTDGKTLVVGLPNTILTNGNRVGEVRVYQQEQGAWALQQTLQSLDNLADTSFEFEGFGAAVSVQGDRLAIGAPTFNTSTYTNTNGVVHGQAIYLGAVEIYDRDSEGQWNMTQRLTIPGNVGPRYFGAVVKLDGDNLILDAGSDYNSQEHPVHNYRLTNGVWQLTQSIQFNNNTNGDVQTIAQDGNTMVVTLRGPGGGTDYGRVYTRTNADSDWVFEQEIEPAYQGARLRVAALRRNTIVLASGGRAATDVVSVFERGPSGWTETYSDTEANTAYGCSAAIDESGNTILVGIGNDTIGSDTNLFSVAMLQRSGGTWVETGGRQAVPADYSISVDNISSRRAIAVVPGEPQVLAIARQRSTGSPGVPAVYGVFSFEPDDRVPLYEEYAIAAGQDPLGNTAAFRYKVHLYGPDPQNAANLIPTTNSVNQYYNATAAATAASARDAAIAALNKWPDSRYYQDLLLDIVYDQTVAETIPADQSLQNIDLVRINPPSNVTGFVIDDEIAAYQSILTQLRQALTGNLVALMNDPVTANAFFERTSQRPLLPAVYLDDSGQIQPTTTGVLLGGYKDADLFFELLGKYGSAAAELAHLHFLNSDKPAAEEVLQAARQFIFINGNTLRERLLDSQGNPPALLETSLAAWTQAMADLSEAARDLDAPLNPLGFSDNFLVLFNRQAAQNENLFDSYDILMNRIDNNEQTFNQIVVAEQAQADAVAAYDTYRSGLDTLADRLIDVTDDAKQRLVEIVGAQYGSPAYLAVPDENSGPASAFISGSELWQQLKNIERARLAIDRNRQQVANVQAEMQIEIHRNLYEVFQQNAIKDIQIEYGNEHASIEEELGNIEAAQKYSESVADAMNPENWGNAVANSINAGIQLEGEVRKGQLRAQKERSAAEEQGKIIDAQNKILNANSQAKVLTMMLQLNTLAVDSLENAVQLSQELGRLVGLYREKHSLERRILTHSSSLRNRFFADPVHRLRYLYELYLANRRFDIAKQYTYFLARTLEYKWNEPFDTIMAGSGYTFDDVFRLRNATEVRLMVEAMYNQDLTRTLPGSGPEYHDDTFSLRQDAFSITGDTADAIQAFRDKLQTMLVGNSTFQELVIPFSTIRDPLLSNPGSQFFRGARSLTVQSDGTVTAQNNGHYLDKIVTLQVVIPGSNTLSSATVATTLSYGGTALIRPKTMPYYPDYQNRPDQLANEFVAYPTLISSFTGTAWQTSSTLSASPTAMMRNDTPPAAENAVDVFRERGVAANGWVLKVLVRDGGVPTLNLDEVNDIQIIFHHRFVTRQSN